VPGDVVRPDGVGVHQRDERGGRRLPADLERVPLAGHVRHEDGHGVALGDPPADVVTGVDDQDHLLDAVRQPRLDRLREDVGVLL
jgi:hypothetical protein